MFLSPVDAVIEIITKRLGIILLLYLKYRFHPPNGMTMFFLRRLFPSAEASALGLHWDLTWIRLNLLISLIALLYSA
ncbi:hypothetical protein P5673_014737 [Acropora cervicornis]|uniref:Uncharacterized protein n=1 Tax=Acropora cervicornis TaxID=6130 RepID=A0AAD9QIW7_ACRCE|nr:hypothetical protein P5673_014737 [Acropora cervicornis]